MKLLQVPFIIIIAVTLSGCYGGIQVHSDIGWGANYNADSSKVVFYKFHKVFRHPKGLLRFPDGGISKTLYENISLYLYTYNSDSLIKVYDFGLRNANRSVWKTTAFFVNNDVVFNLSTINFSDDESSDVQPTDSVRTSISHRWFHYRTADSKVIEIEPIEKDTTANSKASLSLIRKETEHISLLKWGLNFDEIYPQTKRQRLAEIETLDNSIAYTLAIIELMANDLTEKEIDRLVKRINRFVDSKDGYERTSLMSKRNLIVSELKSLNHHE